MSVDKELEHFALGGTSFVSYASNPATSQTLLVNMETTSGLQLIVLFPFQIPRDAKRKLVYIAKKVTESIGVNDFFQTVLFGELPASSLGHVTAFLDEVLVFNI